jgi:trigger factor
MSSTDTDSYDDQAAVDGGEKPKLSLEVKVDSPGACQRHVTVTVAREDIDRYMAEAFDELRPKAEVPGFRPGRAPRKLVETRFKEQISNQVKNSLLMDSLGQVSEEQSFSAISEPDFDLDAVSLPDEGPFTFEFDLEVRPEFDVPVWEGLRLERPVREFTDAEVDRSLQRLLKRYSRYVARETGGAELGDVLDVDLRVTHDGKQVSRSENVRLELAPALSFRDAVIEGFDQLMQGVARGDTRETTATNQRGDRTGSVQGQEVTVSFRVNEVRRAELPKLTPAFLDSIGGFEDEDDLREAVRGELERQVAYARHRQLREQITAKLIEHANWELPPDPWCAARPNGNWNGPCWNCSRAVSAMK